MEVVLAELQKSCNLKRIEKVELEEELFEKKVEIRNCQLFYKRRLFHQAVHSFAWDGEPGCECVGPSGAGGQEEGIGPPLRRRPTSAANQLKWNTSAAKQYGPHQPAQQHWNNIKDLEKKKKKKRKKQL